MKNVFKIFLGAILLFAVINLATSSLQYNADGADNYGFPFNFYTKVSGYNMATKEGNTSTTFDVLALAGDILFAAGISWLLLNLFNKMISTKKANH